mgnify:CR=1 FL=1
MADMLKKVTVQVPATSANCGPGFDCLGLACTLYNRFTYERVPEAEGIQVEAEAREGNPCPRAGTTWRRKLSASFGKNWGNRPPACGSPPGSKSPYPGAWAAVPLPLWPGLQRPMPGGQPSSKEELVTEATRIEGHPDNVAPAILGGITVNVMEEGKVESLKLALARPFSWWCWCPPSPCPLPRPGRLLPQEVSHKDCGVQCKPGGSPGRVSFDRGLSLPADGLEDRLHQPYRLP